MRPALSPLLLLLLLLLLLRGKVFVSIPRAGRCLFCAAPIRRAGCECRPCAGDAAVVPARAAIAARGALPCRVQGKEAPAEAGDPKALSRRRLSRSESESERRTA